MKKEEKKKISVCTLLWRDAAYSYDERLPKHQPQIQLTTGVIIERNNEFTNIATNINYDETTGVIVPIDGFIVPRKTELKFNIIGFLDD